MRPKKVILCVDGNDQELPVLRFMLMTNGYRVLSALTSQEAIAVFASAPQVDLVLIHAHMSPASGSQLVDRLKRMATHVPIIVLSEAQPANDAVHAADAMVVRKNCSPQELLERIKVMSARKRGPRKGAQRMVHVAEQELAAAS